MPFIIDSRTAPKALKRLESLDQVIPFMTEGITYPAISGHTDIFFCVVDGRLIASECVSESILRKLEDSGVNLVISAGKPTDIYPGSALFNAVATDNYLIHRTDVTDKTVRASCSE